MKVGIIGAGISGLAVGQLLRAGHEVVLYERSNEIGGIARAKMVNGIPYHVVGGHCFNSKNPKVMDFVHEKLPRENWHAVKRIAKISFKGNLINYPIEFSIQQIARFDEDLAYRITRDFLSTSARSASNLEDWFRINFGDTLAEEYLIPYNTKIWGESPSVMSANWVQGKLPLPNKKEFFKGLIGVGNDAMPHAEFFYPNDNTQNRFIDALGQGLEVVTDYEVAQIERLGQGWLINGEKQVDALISTMPLNIIPFVIADAPEDIKIAARLLKYNKVSNMLWEADEVEATWTYYPEASTIFHRHIHIGNFLAPKSNATITEVIGDVSPGRMESEGKKTGYLRRSLDYHVSDHAYVVFDRHYANSVRLIKDYLESLSIHTLGRFGEWEYYNMDICIESAMRVAKRFGVNAEA